MSGGITNGPIATIADQLVSIRLRSRERRNQVAGGLRSDVRNVFQSASALVSGGIDGNGRAKADQKMFQSASALVSGGISPRLLGAGPRQRVSIRLRSRERRNLGHAFEKMETWEFQSASALVSGGILAAVDGAPPRFVVSIRLRSRERRNPDPAKICTSHIESFNPPPLS